MEPGTEHLTILGNTVREPTKKLEWFSAPEGGVLDMVTFKTEEFTAMCPITGQPDYATIEVTYQPEDRCLESKSFKLYLQTFRNEGAFCEQLAVTICNDIARAIRPMYIRVIVNQNPRGGIGLTAEASLSLGQIEDLEDDNGQE
jgi:7-cyano-7-deazaguanine reductase